MAVKCDVSIPFSIGPRVFNFFFFPSTRSRPLTPGLPLDGCALIHLSRVGMKYDLERRGGVVRQIWVSFLALTSAVESKRIPSL